MNNIDTSHVAGENRREAWMPKGQLAYFDPVCRQTFHSRQEKRRWLATHGMREAGELINPEKHIAGRSRSKPSKEQSQVQAWITSHGGVEGLLNRRSHV